MVLVPNYRIVELVYFHTENRGESRFYCPEFANCRISFHTESHGESRDLCHELSNCRISFHTEHRGGHGLIVPNLRIVEFFFTRRIAESHGVLSRDLSFGPTDQREVIIVFLSSHGESRRVSGFMSRIIELSNFSSHGASRMVTVLLSRDLSFGPTDQREVICELSNWFIHTECPGWSRRL